MAQNIQIIARREDPFARITKSMLDDSRISWEAKGILSYLLGKPPNWKLQVSDIINHGNAGERKVRASLNELRAFGYAKLVQKREFGKIINWTWQICDFPVFSPDCCFAHVENAHVQNSHLSNNEDNDNDLNNKTKDDAFLNKKADYPSEIQLNAYIDHHELDGIIKSRIDIHGALTKSGWRDGKGKKIKDWKAYICGLNETILTASSKSHGR